MKVKNCFDRPKLRWHSLSHTRSSIFRPALQIVVCSSRRSAGAVSAELLPASRLSGVICLADDVCAKIHVGTASINVLRTATRRICQKHRRLPHFFSGSHTCIALVSPALCVLCTRSGARAEHVEPVSGDRAEEEDARECGSKVKGDRPAGCPQRARHRRDTHTHTPVSYTHLTLPTRPLV